MPPDPPPSDGLNWGEVEVWYAFIGAAIGLLLIYSGTFIPYRILSWPVIGVGVLFVVVMTAYVLSVFWKNASPHARRPRAGRGFWALESRLAGYLDAEAKDEDDPELAAKIGALRVSDHPAIAKTSGPCGDRFRGAGRNALLVLHIRGREAQRPAVRPTRGAESAMGAV